MNELECGSQFAVLIEGGGLGARLLKDDDGGPWFGKKQDADFLASERNRVHGPKGLRYTVIPKASINSPSNAAPPAPQTR